MNCGEHASLLKVFIRSVGFLIFLWSLVAVFFLVHGYVRQVILSGFSPGIVLMAPFLLGIYGVVGFCGWRMFRSVNRETVADYAAIQSLLTAFAVAGVFNRWHSGLGIFVFVIVFILTRTTLKGYVLRYLDLPRKHSRRYVETATVRDVAGTPWQDDPAHTAR